MYLKPLQSITEIRDRNIEFDEFINEIRRERELLVNIPNVLPYSSELETNNCLFVTRPYVFCSLYDRISLRPFLSQAEKKWITYQLLMAIRDAHAAGVCHGDIKSENALLTASNWVYVTDFAGFKPTLLPEDDPADFAFYFDSSSRRNCYIAPERFVSATVERERKLTKAMDIFSLGCVIAELFLEGTVLFSFSQLLAYRNGGYSADQLLERIDDKEIRSLVQHMIQKDPSLRLDASEYLIQWSHAFPSEYSTFMHDYVFKLMHGEKRAALNRSDHTICKVFNDFEQISQFMNLKKLQGKFVHDKTLGFRLDCYRPVNDNRSEGALILLTLICSALRNTSLPCYKIMGLELINVLARMLNDRLKLDRCVPYCISLFKDINAMVRSTSLRVVTLILASAQEVSVADANIFVQYIMPQCQHFPEDVSTLVRITHASLMATLAGACRNFLEVGSINSKVKDKDLIKEDKASARNNYDSSLVQLQELFEEQAVKVLTDPCSQVKITLLKNIGELCLFFGKQMTHDILLSHIITYLNDQDPRLRVAFFEAVVAIGTFLGAKNVEQYILPLLIQGLYDTKEEVSERAILSLKSLTNLGYFSRFKLRELVRDVTSFLIHPDACVRNCAVLFLSSSRKHLMPIEIACFVMPILRAFIKFPMSELSEEALSAALVNPIEKMDFLNVLSEAEKSLKETISGEDPYLNRTLTLDHAEFMKRLDDTGLSDAVQGKIGLILPLVERIALKMRKRSSSKLETPMQVEVVTSPKTVFLPSIDAKDTPSSTSALLPHFRAASLPSGGNLFSVSRTQKLLPKLDYHANSSQSTPDLARSFSSAAQFRTINATQSASKPQSLLPSQESSRAPPSLITTNAIATVETEGKSEFDVKSPTAYITSPDTSSAKPPFPSSGADITDVTGDYVFEEAIGRLLEKQMKDAPKITTIRINSVQTVPGKHKKSNKSPSYAPNIQTWTPSSFLVATYSEHKCRIMGLELSADQIFFATSSADGCLCIWDCHKLEKNVTDRSRLHYWTEGGTAIKCMRILDSSHCIAIGLEDGSIEIIRVFVTPGITCPPKYSQCQRIKRIMLSDEEFAIQVNHVNYDSKSILIVSTSKNNLYAFDLQREQVLWKHRVPVYYGAVSSVDVDTSQKNWIALGTRQGIIICIDLRFGFVFRIWLHPLKSPITALRILPSVSKNRRLLCACGDSELSVWDIEKLACKELLIAHKITDFKIGKYAKLYKQLPQLPQSHDLPEPKAIPEDEVPARIFGLHFLQASGQIISAGTDMRIRMWNMASYERSTSFGLNDGHERHYKTLQADGMMVCQESSIKSAIAKQNQPSHTTNNPTLSIGVILGEEYTKRPTQTSGEPIKSKQLSPVEERYYFHSDCITHLAVTETPYPMLISASRDGTVKVWK